MKLRELTVGSFGKLSDKTLSFTDGINIVYGKNEAGKSTLSAFIAYLLYGFPSKTHRVADNDKLHYAPWNGSPVSGSGVFETKGGTYRVERQNGTKPVCRITSLSSGEPLNPGREPGEVFLGCDASTFARTAYIRQTETAFSGEDGGLAGAVQNMLLAADETVNTEKARKKLTEHKNVLRNSRHTDEVTRLTEHITSLEEQERASSEAHRELLAAEAKLENTRGSIAADRKRLDDLAAETENLLAQEAYDTLNGLLAASDALEKASETDKALEETVSVGGQRITHEALSDLLVLDGKCGSCRIKEENAGKALDEAEEALKELSKENGLPPAFLEEGFDDKAVSKKLKGKKAAAVILCVLGILLTGVGALLYFLFPTLFAGAVYAAAGIAGAGVVALVVSLIVFMSRRSLASAVGLTSVKELKEALARRPIYRKALLERTAILAERRDTFGECRKETLAASNALREASRALGIDSLDENFDASAFASSLRDRLSRYESAHAAYLQKQSAYEALRLAAGDPDALRAKAASYTGEPSRPRAAIEREVHYYQNACEALAAQEKDLLQKTAVHTASLRKPAEILAEKEATEAKLSDASEKADALEMAIGALDDACNELRQQFTPRVASRADELFGQITCHTHGPLSVSRSFGVDITENGFLRESAYLSAGTADAAYLSLRVALAENLFGEPPFLVFDEAFANMDDDRLAASLEALETIAGERQIILFTCHTREMDHLGDKAHVITL